MGEGGVEEGVGGGGVEGPRIVPATYAVGATGGHCDDTGLPPYYDKKAPSGGSGPEDAREKGRWMHKYGGQGIKICATGGGFFARGHGRAAASGHRGKKGD